MINLKIRTKLLLAGIGISLALLLVIMFTVFNQNRNMIDIGKKESLKLAYVDLEHIVNNLYILAESHQEVTQKNINSALRVAHLLAENSGDFTFSDKKVSWNATNQYTKSMTSIELPKMQLGDQWLGQTYSLNEYVPFVDPIRNTLDVTCTVFQRMNQAGDMLRVATNVERSEGVRAIGTYIPATNPDGQPNPVISSILKGETFKGRAYVVNSWFISSYEPILDNNKNIVGVLYVGIPQENVDSLSKAIMETTIGKNGYVTVVDSTGTNIISKKGVSNGLNSKNTKDATGRLYIQERIKLALKLTPKQIGKQQFLHKFSDNEPTLRDASFVYFAPWDWIITAEANEADFTEASTQLAALGTKGNVTIATAAAFILLLTAVLWYFMSNSITKPVKKLSEVFEKYAAGDTEVRADIHSTDELGYFANEFNSLLDKINETTQELKESEATYKGLFGQLQEVIETSDYTFNFSSKNIREDLAASLNKMLHTLDNAQRTTNNQTWLKSGEADLNAIISSERDLMALCQNALAFMAKYVDAQVGTFFVRKQDSETYSLLTNYAYRERKGIVTTFKPGEGLAGQAALGQESIIFSEVPEDYIRVESTLGNTSPTYLVAIPLVYENDVKGVIELGTTNSFTKLEMDFLDLAAKILAVAMNTALFNEKLEVLLDQTKKQAKILEEQQEELKAANEELQEHTDILKKSETRLQLQQEELQASNEELEEKTEILEGQKSEIAEKNSTLRTKQVEVEEKARQLELATKYKSEFLANMSHELRTPLNSLLILSSLLAENDGENLTEDQVESAIAIQKGGNSLLRLINDILDLSKIEARKIELSVTNTSIENICNNSKAEFTHMADQKGLNLEIIAGENIPNFITTDEHRLNQIIRNLIGNSIKFTETGTVKLAIERPNSSTIFKRAHLASESTIAFSVSDTGIGVSEEKIAAIFEAFTQADGSITRRHGGTGLGLSISKELALLLGGELTAESVEGQGATFTLYLPEIFTPPNGIKKGITNTPLVLPTKMAESQKQTITLSQESETLQLERDSQPSTRTKTMLIIEDDPEFAKILANFFKKNGYQPIIAPDGESGIRITVDNPPTAIVLDLGLPGIDGWTVLSELKGNASTRHIPVHILSGCEDTRQGLEKGAVGYLTKPVETDGLQQVLCKIESVLNEDVKKLLIVEDDDHLRATLLKVMKNEDIVTETAKTGMEALQLLRTNHYDCMILDLGLPDISGFELLDTIQKSHELAQIPVIIYTGRDLSQDETAMLEAYASSIVLKSAASIDRLLDETALFMHRVEANIPEDQRKMIQRLRDRESVLPGKIVLVVDDDMRNALALNKFLKTKGMEVIVADNGQRALDVLQDEQQPRPDIILMDIMMPIMNGYEAMKLIKADPVFKEIPILALTAKAMASDREDCINAGANDYLAKPVDTSKLLTMLRVWLYS